MNTKFNIGDTVYYWDTKVNKIASVVVSRIETDTQSTEQTEVQDGMRGLYNTGKLVSVGTKETYHLSEKLGKRFRPKIILDGNVIFKSPQALKEFVMFMPEKD